MTIIAIIGPSGSGKDTVARLLHESTPYDLLVSYTTRPIRDGEVNGREHHFVQECTIPQDQMLAYTEYGGYQYWVPLPPCAQPSHAQPSLDNTPNTAALKAALPPAYIYVIDEAGVLSIQDRFPDIRIIRVLVTATPAVRYLRGISEERMLRDLSRTQFPLESFSFIIRNNKSLSALKHNLQNLRTHLTKIIK